ncbi:hypothetical protein LguiB_034778 [Lonicera macranthoides]
MEGDASWSDDEFEFDNSRKGTGVFHPCLGLIDNDDRETTDKDDEETNVTSIDVLPDDLQERILSSLPVACTFKACCVRKKWNKIVHSRKFILKNENISSKKPWYFMFTSSDEPLGFIYDSVLRQWYNYELPFIVKHTWIVAPSCGLVCFMDEDISSDIYVCNPITRNFKKLDEPLDPQFSVYSTLAFSVDRSTHRYTVAIIRTRQASDDYLQWDISIHFYYSETSIWPPPVIETLVGWRAGNVSVICNGVLYFLVFSTRTGETQNSHGLLTYNLDNDNSSSNGKLIDTFIPVPCSLTCGRLMNLQNKLVMVGGIGRQDRPGIIKGIGIWVLEGREWDEISKVPHKFFQGFGELDDVFASTGGGDLIYIQSYGGTALLVFDMNLRQWNWSQKCPMSKKFPLQLFSGFCFEPRLEVSP